MQTLAKTIFITMIVLLSWLLLVFFINLIYNQTSIIEYDDGYRYGRYSDVCLDGCSEIYNECMGEEGESLEMCIADKDYEIKVLKSYK